jgi:hypothetical protein
MQKSPSPVLTISTKSLPEDAVAAPLRHPFDLPQLPRVLAALVIKILEQKFPQGIFSKWSIRDVGATVFAHERDVTANLVRSDNV